jgi:hypothetical protein
MYLVTRPTSASRPEFKAFHDWIVGELAVYWAEVERALPCDAATVLVPA